MPRSLTSSTNATLNYLYYGADHKIMYAIFIDTFYILAVGCRKDALPCAIALQLAHEYENVWLFRVKQQILS